MFLNEVFTLTWRRRHGLLEFLVCPKIWFTEYYCFVVKTFVFFSFVLFLSFFCKKEKALLTLHFSFGGAFTKQKRGELTCIDLYSISPKTGPFGEQRKKDKQLLANAFAFVFFGFSRNKTKKCNFLFWNFLLVFLAA